MNDEPVPAYIKDNAQALKDYLSIRGLKDGEIERAFIRFEEFIIKKTMSELEKNKKDSIVDWSTYKPLTKHKFRGIYLGYFPASEPTHVFLSMKDESGFIVNAQLPSDELDDLNNISRKYIDHPAEMEVLISRDSKFAIVTSMHVRGLA